MARRAARAALPIDCTEARMDNWNRRWRAGAAGWARLLTLAASDLGFRWPQDGQAVCLLRNERPIAFVSASHVHGYSKALTKPSVLGAPWDKRLYQLTFQ
jgi:hypothetical protein